MFGVGAAELIILMVPAAVVVGVVFLVIRLTKKK